MKRQTLFVGVCIFAAARLSAGWFERAVWIHPTKTETDFQKDYNDCQQKAAQNAANWGMRGNIFSIASDTNQCLVDLGWKKVNAKALNEQQASPAYVIDLRTTLKDVLRATRGIPDAPIHLSADGTGFRDDVIRTTGTAPIPLVEADVENTGPVSVRILWDEASYIDQEGLSHRVTHSGVEFSERTKSQMPTTVPAAGRVHEAIIASDAILQNGARWVRAPQMLKEATLKDGRFTIALDMTVAAMNTNVAARNVGKNVRVVLPIDVNGTVREYTFIFTIDETKVRQPTMVDLDREFLLSKTSL